MGLHYFTQSIVTHFYVSASIILHTLLQSVSGKPNSASSPYQVPTLARMEPLTEAKTKEVFEEITPEMYNLIIEANIKNQTAGPIATAWDAALRRSAASASASATANGAALVTPRTRNFWEKAAEAGADTESSIVFVEPVSASLTDDGEVQLPRVPSTPRLGRRGLSSSPTKGQSPVRRASFGPAAGEI